MPVTAAQRAARATGSPRSAGERPGDAGQHEGRQGAAVHEPGHADGGAGQQAEDHDPVGVADDHGRREQRAERGTGQGERRPAVRAEAARITPPAASSTTNVPEPEVPERQDDRRPARRRRGSARTARRLPGDAGLGPEPAEQRVQRRLGRHGRGGRRRGRRAAVTAGSWGRGQVTGSVGGSCGRSTRTRAPVLRRLGVDDVDGAAVQVGHPAGDGEAEAGAAAAVGLGRGCRSARRRGPGRRRGCPGRRRRPRAASRLPVALGGDPDDAAGGAVPRRVVEQVGDQLVQPGRVGGRRSGRAGRRGRRTRRRDRSTRASATARSSSSQRRAPRSADSGASPASTRARSSRSEASAESRSAWSSAVRRATGSGSATPSTRFSSTAHRAASGVRSSWLTLATSSRRCRSTAARSSAIRLKARASSPTSSLEVAVTRPE